MLRECWYAGIREGWQRLEMFGGRELKRPRPKFGTSATGEEELLATGDGTIWPSAGWNKNSWNVSYSIKLKKEMCGSEKM
jgi:hypothetical protein